MIGTGKIVAGSAGMPPPPVQNHGKKKQASTVKIGGLSISFPFEPYEAQKLFMAKAVDAMEAGTNALLESPTGTGKTLCLLCSTLAWRKDHDKMKTKSKVVSNVNVDFKGNTSTSAASTTIIYASRTHSQLQQVVSELKSSVYAEDVKMTILGSRDQLCSNRKIRLKSSGNALTKVCNSLTTNHRCPHKNNFDNKHKDAEGASTWLNGLQDNFLSLESTSSSSKGNWVKDVEELVSIGEREEVCSFFHSRAATKTADLVLMPYNYLFNRRNQRALSINWHNCVVVIDEAHNVESAACESLSKSFSSGDLSRVISELQSVLRSIKNGIPPAIEEMLPNGTPEKKAAMLVLTAVFEMEKRVDAVELTAAGPGPKPSCDKPAEWLTSMLESIGFKAEQRFYVLTQLDLMCDFLAIKDLVDASDSATAQSSAMPGKEAALVKFLDLLFLSYPRTSEEIEKGYLNNKDSVVYICESDGPSNKNSTGSDGRRTVIPARTNKKKGWVLNYWCFSAGVALKQLQNLGVRSLLLASGTLSPMGALKADFALPFPVELENKHVISNSQIWVSAVGKGPTGGQLNSTMKVRGLSTYKDELGNSIVNICLTMMGKGFSRMPAGPRVNGGVLIFFPTYFVMEDCVRRWKEGPVWHKLETAGGKVFIEPRGGGDSANSNKPQAKSSASSSYPSKGGTSKTIAPTPVDRPIPANTNSSVVFDNFIRTFESAVKRDGNAILLAVCQGKVSEGIDFTDDKGRAVIVTGIPYAPIGDAWVVLKRRYLDERVHGLSRPAASSSSSSSADATGQRRTAESVYGNPSAMNMMNALSASSRVGWTAGMANSTTIQHNKSALSQTAGVAKMPAPSAQVNNNPNMSGKRASADGITGETWYSQTASRAVNQALGRIIRHKNDWGAIFLLDDRFERESQKKHLSSWIRPRVEKHHDFSQCMESFRNFLSVNSHAGSSDGTGGPSDGAGGRGTASAPGTRAPVDWDRQKRKQAVKASSIGSKKVTVNIDELLDDLDGEDGGISFINPDFFLSQQQNQAPVAPKERAVIVGASKSAPPRSATASKPRSMSEMLKTKKKPDPLASGRDTGEDGGRSSSSSRSAAQALYLRNMNGTGVVAPASTTSNSGASLSNTGTTFDVFNFGGGNSVPWVKVEEAPKVSTKNTTVGVSKPSQQSMLGFMKKRGVSTPQAQPGDASADPLRKRAKQSPLSPDPFDLDSLEFRPPDNSSDHTSLRAANIVCGVCRQKDPSDACTSRSCGHICCKSCWVSWLRVNKSCPLCKVPVTEDGIRALNFS